MQDRDDYYMSQGEYMTAAVREYARNHGAEDTESEWISSPFDTWEKNPHYTGKPGRHPEDDYDDNGVHYSEEGYQG